MNWALFVKLSLCIGLMGSVGLMLCVMLPVKAILLSGSMVLFGFSVSRMDKERQYDNTTE